MTGADLGVFSQLRMLRAFRVFRLFKRIKSLNKIITSLGHAVPGIVNAAIVQFLVMCIYASTRTRTRPIPTYACLLALPRLLSRTRVHASLLASHPARLFAHCALSLTPLSHTPHPSR